MYKEAGIIVYLPQKIYKKSLRRNTECLAYQCW